ncbi:MAE_28990/MAE_18760 family HEPN-like nuclease [Clostridium sp. AM49-4BH]|jgi:hypothetical protein|uniref:HEPN domain-containing protein n=1 Tax=Clostridium sp. AM49-4BH TaxID=2293035 RepID=UPI000E51C2A0|nr:MAE_28990/MAE_18760 family HEPN-like nuclease [Clostridium sp. AM49-4BH]RHQ09539.1 hypothetical protein DW981_13030 [Clostridium sp. AM49-4BH]
MKSDYVDLIKNTDRELQEIRKWINADKNRFDTKTKYLIAYSVIKASGSIEVVFKQIIYDYLTREAGEKTATYIEKMILDSSCNPNTGNMSNLLQNISSEWKEQFDALVKESGKKSKINSLVQLRNDFAHGDNITVSIDTVISYFDAAKDILNILDTVVN